MQVLQEKLNFLLEKYSVEAKAVLKDKRAIRDFCLRIITLRMA